MFSKLHNREAGGYRTSCEFPLEASGTESAGIYRLRRKHELVGHDGCVNTVSFTPDGRSLLSGSDDRVIKIWDWEAGECSYEWESMHTNNIFQARLIGAGDKTVISSAADGQVRLHLLSSSGRVTSKKVGQHDGRAHKLAVDPSQIHSFYSSGEDAIVRHYDVRQRRAGCEQLVTVYSTVTSRRNEAVDLNSIHVNPTKPQEFVAAGDEEWAYVYDARMIRMQRRSLQVTPTATPVEKFCPHHLASQGRRAFAHITACAYSRRGELLLSYNGDAIFLFHPWLKGRSGKSNGAEETAWKRQRNRSDHSQAQPPKRTRKGHGKGKRRSVEPPNDDSLLGMDPAGLPQPVRRAKQHHPRHPAGGETIRPDGSGGSSSQHAHERDRQPDSDDVPGAGLADLASDDQRTADAAVAEHSNAHAVVQREAERTAPRDDSGESTADSDSELQREMNDANSAAEDLLRGLFEDAVINGWLRRRDSQREAAPPVVRQRLSEDAEADNGSEQAGSDRPPGTDREDDGWEASEGDDADEGEGQDEDGEDDDDADENDSIDYGELIDDDSDVDEEIWPQQEGAFRQRAAPATSAPHCLRGYVREEDSNTWLHPKEDCMVQRFDGHRNLQTVKGVSFLGLDDEFVATGSDCGHLFVWSKRDGRLRRMLHGDSHVLNCVEPHPHQPFTVATSGIDDDIKIWTGEARPDAQMPVTALGGHQQGATGDVEALEAVLRSNTQRQAGAPLRSSTFLPFLLHFRQLQQLG